jgi:hypothetical protein
MKARIGFDKREIPRLRQKYLEDLQFTTEWAARQRVKVELNSIAERAIKRAREEFIENAMAEVFSSDFIVTNRN